MGNVQITERLLSQGVIGPELDEKIRHMAARWVFMDSNIEMLPEPTNRMTLSPSKRDFYGLPLMDIYYDVNDYARAAGEVIRQDYAQFLKLLSGEIFDQNLTQWENRDHPMGTVIMGHDPRDSVVNAEGRSHDHDNLFIATTGIMPAASVVNPTLTGCALSLRSASIMLREI
ncbi:GMC oxidoreductase [Asaia platycodi]|uniref:GMC oxidoreductase n=1 Tax=Asaia platycodi TaxID=610243 RepID=UPI000B236535|nr:GMC family oxidoreductase [Asaia platycodi]